MKRREFITLFGAAAALPVAARAQQPERVRRIGMLYSLAEDDPESLVRRAAFEQALKDLGWINGGNLRIDYRGARGDPQLIRKFVAELVASAPDVIVTSTSQATGPMVRATHNIPIVFVQVMDPVGSGFVESMAQPGRNVTGFMQFEYSIAGRAPPDARCCPRGPERSPCHGPGKCRLGASGALPRLSLTRP